MVKFLIQQGADVNTKNGDGATALHGAAFLGRSQSAKLLIENGANIKTKDSNGATCYGQSQIRLGHHSVY